MRSYQTQYKKNAGFTLVEIMVVILIIAILLLLGNYGDINKRREKARLEELAVEIVSMIDQEKVDTLLGRTEGGAIVRKRKIEISFGANSITYKAYADLAEDTEGLYCGVAGNTINCPNGIASNTPLTTKTWTYPFLDMKIYNCDTDAVIAGALTLTAILQGDAMSFTDTNTSAVKHIVLQISRLGSYREIHIDRRTGVTYEREGVSGVSCI